MVDVGNERDDVSSSSGSEYMAEESRGEYSSGVCHWKWSRSLWRTWVEVVVVRWRGGSQGVGSA